MHRVLFPLVLVAFGGAAQAERLDFGPEVYSVPSFDLRLAQNVGTAPQRAPGNNSLNDGDGGADLQISATPEITAKILKYLKETEEFCDIIPIEYQIDCSTERLDTLARSLPKFGDYGLVRQALTTAADDLREVVAANQDGGAAPKRFRSPAGTTTRRALTPIRPDRLPAARQQAANIIEEATTTLLRSAENSRRRQIHFQQIATALESNKLLLRSG